MPSDRAVSQEVVDRYVYMRDNGHIDFINLDKECIGFVTGRGHWTEEEKRILERQRRPAYTFNKILPALAAIWSQQLDGRADVGIKPKKSGAQATADILQKVMMYISENNKYQRRETVVFQRATSGGGRGYFDVRMGFDDSVTGEVRIREEHPRNVFLDPDSSSYDPDEWGDVIISKWRNLNDIEMLYGKAAMEELKGKTKSSFNFGYDFIDDKNGSFGGVGTRISYTDSPIVTNYREIARQFKKVALREHFVDKITGDTRMIPKNLARERIQALVEEFDLAVMKRKTNVYHWTTVIDDVVVFDEESVYKHFTIVPYFPFFIDGATVGLTENQIDPAKLYNKSRSNELHVLSTTSNSGWKVKTGSLQNMTIEDLEERGAETGLVLELSGNPNEDVVKIQPNQVPTGLDRMSFIAAQDLKEISMVPDSMRGADRADVAAKAIAYKNIQGSANFAGPMENLEYTRQLVWERVLDLVQQFMTDERRLKITGNDLNAEAQEFTINEVNDDGEVLDDLTLGEYGVAITSIPARRTFEETQFDAAKDLRELGIAIPDDILIEYSPLSRKAEIAKRIAEKNGDGDPTETQKRMAELELQLKELEARKADVEAKKTEADTALILVRAQQAAEDTGKQDNSGEVASLAQERSQRQQVLAKMRMEKYKVDREIELKREELAFEREKHTEDMRLREKEMAKRSAEQKPKTQEQK